LSIPLGRWEERLRTLMSRIAVEHVRSPAGKPYRAF
jgi:hypothetical protein